MFPYPIHRSPSIIDLTFIEQEKELYRKSAEEFSAPCLEFIRKLNKEKLKIKETDVAAKENVLKKDKETQKGISYDIFQRLEYEKAIQQLEILKETEIWLQSENAKKDIIHLYNYLLETSFEYLFFIENESILGGLTKDIDFIYENSDTGDKFLWNFGKFRIKLKLDGHFEENIQNKLSIQRIGDERWNAIRREKILNHDHPHINYEQPCLGSDAGFSSLTADCFNKSRYLNILWLIETSFLRSFNPENCYPTNTNGAVWKDIFTRKGELQKDDK